MKKVFQLPGLVLSGLLAMAHPAAYGSEDHHREHGTHEHGMATMNIAIEDRQLHIELESPAMNIVGFEHAPRTHEQKQAVERATQLLKKTEKLFILPAKAQCQLAEADVESPLTVDSHHNHDENHSEFHARYIFQCQQVNAIKEIDVQLFNEFKATEEIKVQIISGKGQTVKKLTPHHYKLVF